MHTPTSNARFQWLLAVLLLIAAGAFGVVAAGRMRANRGIAQLLPSAAGTSHTAFLVMRPEDCDGNLDVLDLFQRAAVRERVTFGAIIMLGTGTLSDDATRLLRARGINTPVVRADLELTRRLAESGWHTTPLLLILSHQGTMRAALPTPNSVPAYLALASTLQSLPTPERE